MPLKLFTCTDHDGHWAVPVASLVFAENEAQARWALDAALMARGLRPYSRHAYTLADVGVMVDATGPRVIVLSDGNY